VYSDEDLSDNPKLAQMARIKSQVRLWGYEAKATQKQQQFTDILCEGGGLRTRVLLTARWPNVSYRHSNPSSYDINREGSWNV
jgi:hypothetical protein